MSTTPTPRSSTLRTVLLVVGSILVASIVVYLGVSAITAANRQDASREIAIDESFSAIEVTAEVTDVVIEFADVDEATVRLAQNAERRSMTFEAEVVDDTLVATVIDHGTGWWLPLDFTDSPRLTIVLPEGGDNLDLTIESDVGDLAVEGDFAQVTIVSTAGDLRLSGSAANLEVETTVGDVISRGYAVDDQLTIRSNTGDVEFALDELPRGIDVSSNVGDQDVELPNGRYRVETSTNVGEVQVDVDQDQGSSTVYRFETTVGDITVEGSN